MNIAIACCNRDDYKAETVGTLFYLGIQAATYCKKYVPFIQPQTCWIDVARNVAWDTAKGMGVDGLLFIDSDVDVMNITKVDVIERLISLRKDIITGIYVDRQFPYRAHIYNFTKEGLIQNIPDFPMDKPFKLDGGPGGFLYISKKVMDAFTPEVEKELGKPFHIWHYGQPDQIGEDVAFCMRAKKLGIDVWADPTIQLGHSGKQKFTLAHWEQAKQMIRAQNDQGGIEGWMTGQEMDWLRTTSVKMESIVEIGSWKGRSTKELLDSGSKVYAVDHFQGSNDCNDETFKLAKEQDIYAEFMKNVGHYPNLEVVRMDSKEAAKQVEDKSVDMVFIDSEHTYDGVKADILRWYPKATKIISGHDFEDGWPGVKRAVTEIFGQVKTCGSIWYVDITQGPRIKMKVAA
jgi:hypothetical protein